MYSFRNDYSEGAHPDILEALTRTNLIQTPGYGEDSFCEEARMIIKKQLQSDRARIYFLAGGTQTNLTAIAALLKPYEAVIAAHTGHVNVHETGAIEATGHKVLTCQSRDGKLTPGMIRDVLAAHETYHMVKPALVYISDSTEVGTIYNRRELMDLYAYCQQNSLLLFLDGARLGAALSAAGNDLRLADLAAYTDCFYIGGTKNGALLGEAFVINRPELAEDFRYHVKQRGGLLAKGRVVGIQFLTLFQNDLFFRLAAHADNMALKLKRGIAACGYEFLTDSVTNQQFPIFPDGVVKQLKQHYEFEIQEKPDPGHTCIRLVTSWATSETEVDQFLTYLKGIVI